MVTVRDVIIMVTVRGFKTTHDTFWCSTVEQLRVDMTSCEKVEIIEQIVCVLSRGEILYITLRDGILWKHICIFCSLSGIEGTSKHKLWGETTNACKLQCSYNVKE